ncbi:unnamed protein product [Medioppia subpectinata]|uniref:Fatty acid hydroxylase domain-containing protein n=1 Tax=Medioppia subpectinata TaxID=1979941 RepID=A0A7R9KDT0_9ACAR|nr:unnamed protein product [Medioppia subpectinata]CAG2101437.1 unnamed protein product [Medioppia subpectinata]
MTVTSKDVYKTMKNVLLNQILIQFALSLISLPILRRHEYSVSRQDFSPNYWRILIHLLICVVIEEMGFYYSHRLLHLNKFYKYIHSKHHHWTVPTAIAASYCHPIEHIISNVLPIVLQIHSLQTPSLDGSHSYCRLLLSSNRAHNLQCFAHLFRSNAIELTPGLFMVMDSNSNYYFTSHPLWLSFTPRTVPAKNKLFRKSKESQRHKWLLTTKPSQEVLWNPFTKYMYGLWDEMVDIFIKYDLKIQHHGTFIWSFSVYWISSLTYSFIDLYRWPACIYKYKIDKTYQVTSKDFSKTIKGVVLNQIIIYLGLYLFAFKVLLKHDSKSCQINYWRFLYQLMFCMVVEEFGFYSTHRLLHLKKLYKYIHYKHHEYTTPTAIASAYCHPFEHIFSNLFPLYLGPLLLTSHLAFLWFWIAFGTLTSVHTHSGFHLPLTASPQFHEYHHSHPNQNFGVSGILDQFFGTDLCQTIRKETRNTVHNIVDHIVDTIANKTVNTFGHFVHTIEIRLSVHLFHSAVRQFPLSIHNSFIVIISEKWCPIERGLNSGHPNPTIGRQFTRLS